MHGQVFSPNYITKLILEPLRHMFSGPQVPSALRWSTDPNKTGIEIGQYEDLIKQPVQVKPRIIVNRGGYGISKTGLTDNLAQTNLTNRGVASLEDVSNLVMISGNAQIIIDSPSQGECELITDMVTHFLIWLRPGICDTQGFKDFALPMSVSPCQIVKGDVEVFQVQISFGYLIEESWRAHTDALKIKDILWSFKPLP